MACGLLHLTTNGGRTQIARVPLDIVVMYGRSRAPVVCGNPVCRGMCRAACRMRGIHARGFRAKPQPDNIWRHHREFLHGYVAL